MGANDFASMNEVLGRRFRRTKAENESERWVMPDLVLIDGGPQQLAFAQEAMHKEGIYVPMFGLAERLEEIWLPNCDTPVVLDHHTPALHLVQRIRDEAHRFAITHHRSLRGKASVHSSLEDIPGIGPARRRALLSHFGSIKAIREADEAQLAAVKGMNAPAAHTIYAFFHPNNEEIPHELERSALQRVIQLLKHHRDIYFCRIKKEDMKPTSAIITTLCALIAKDKNSELNVFELLTEIVNELEKYSQYELATEKVSSFTRTGKNIIRKQNAEWHIDNPVNPYDNLADLWNDGSEKAALFFKWVSILKRDFLDSLNIDDNDFIAVLENNFGRDYVRRRLDLRMYNSTPIGIITNTPKPWGE